MDATYPLHAASDPLFYDRPHRRGVTAGEQFAPAATASWVTWTQTRDDSWSFCTPPDVTVPEQGWKIHVSATPGTAEAVLAAVSLYCHRTRLPFKFLRDHRILRATLSKDGDRRVSGKFLTVYPTFPDDLESHLTELDAALAGLPGPYVLTDLRWKKGPVYVRYGAFTRQFVSDNGVDVPAVRDLHTGTLVPDVRSTSFHVPPWVQIPAFLQAELDQLGSAPPDQFPQVQGALQFSNAGGVYEAELDGRRVILKEARPHVGWTPDGRDAVQRLHDETVLLQSLSEHVPVPVAITAFSAYDHAYLAMERIDAPSLHAAVVARNPLVSSDVSMAARRAYRDWAVAVASSLRQAVADLHATGQVHGDLHPGNVLVNDDATVVLIDLEMSRPIDDAQPSVIGAAGFVATDGRNAADQDLYALACIELSMFVPLVPLMQVDPAKAGELVAEAANQFDLDSSWANDRLSTLARRKPLLGQAAPQTSPTATTPLTTIAALTQTLLADATLDRQDRLWPGDPAQFSEPVGSLAHGALGVLTALHHAGVAGLAQHHAWVDAAEARSESPRRFGLFDGIAGAVWAYRQLGHAAAADRHLARLSSVSLDRLGFDLYGGLPGVGLTLLAESGVQPHLAKPVVDIATRLKERWQDAEPSSHVVTGRGGLLHGATGTALFALRLHEITGDSEHLRLATEAIEYDLRSLRAAPDGSLHVDEGWRLLPYLGNGSAGIGLVIAQLLDHLPGNSRYLEILDGIVRAASTPFTIQSGLFQGRAGLIQFLLAVGRTELATVTTSAAVHDHVSALRLHQLRRGDELRFVGNGLLRASCDLATGAAGVLATLIDYEHVARGTDDNRTFLPFLTPFGVEDQPLLPAARPSGGGEMYGVPPLPSVA
ncbi:class III lanthionine synthetase LanKC [Microbacterium ureisolvens]|uniref:non-specific serine/threonine protein kinase n=1 Tax=Microbacterium ureisolvens TaxID=2781186 RepID=A0ABS7HZY5_9MICO|nr:class III lanthionine synthetase LanKC [Microbacterium ureisolvens]MBW9110165.1 class III lanthionine synthetase LanKC [Microbacterium ureisolvens]